MSYVAKNNALSTLAGSLTNVATSATVQAGAGALFAVTAPDYTYCTLEDASGNIEVIKLTARATDTLTIVRAQDGTAARAWNIGDIIECRPCAAALNDYAVGPQIDGSTAKTTPVDADTMGLIDSAASNVLKKVTWANIKATFYAALGALIAAGTSKSTPVGGDSFAISDSAASGATKTLTFTNLWATLVATALTWTAKQIFTGTMKVQQSLEKETITAAAPSATQTFDLLTQAIQWFTTNPTANWTLNVRGDGSNSLDSIMAVGESATITVKSTMGATPYYASGFQIDGGAVTPKWIGGTAPTSGDASCINIYTYSITKTAAATFIVIASKAKTS